MINQLCLGGCMVDGVWCCVVHGVCVCVCVCSYSHTKWHTKLSFPRLPSKKNKTSFYQVTLMISKLELVCMWN